MPPNNPEYHPPDLRLNTHTQSPSPEDGISNAFIKTMNASLQARVRHLFTVEFARRGLLTWDMKLALQHALAEHSHDGSMPLPFDRRPNLDQISNGHHRGTSNL